MAISACCRCGREFYTKASWVAKGFGKFCSRSCQHLASRKGKELPCSICGRLSYKQRKDLGRSKSGKFFCGKSCQTSWRNQLYTRELHKNFTTGQSSYRAVMKRAAISQICSLCKIADIRVLAVHHIDKNRDNNKLENLAWLCHNCHFLVHHYEGERKRFMAAIV